MNTASLAPLSPLAPPRPRRRALARRGIVALALLPVVALVALELLGARGDVGFLSGTAPPYGELQLISGACYAACWFTAVVASPIALLGVGLDYGLGRLLSRRGAGG